MSARRCARPLRINHSEHKHPSDALSAPWMRCIPVPSRHARSRGSYRRIPAMPLARPSRLRGAARRWRTARHRRGVLDCPRRDDGRQPARQLRGATVRPGRFKQHERSRVTALCQRLATGTAGAALDRPRRSREGVYCVSPPSSRGWQCRRTPHRSFLRLPVLDSNHRRFGLGATPTIYTMPLCRQIGPTAPCRQRRTGRVRPGASHSDPAHQWLHLARSGPVPVRARARREDVASPDRHLCPGEGSSTNGVAAGL